MSHTFAAAVTGSHPNKATLEHLIYLPSSNLWVERTSKPQPFITVSLSTRHIDYKTIHHPLSKEGHTTTEAMADTGCQSCLMSVHTAKALGLTPRDYLKARMRMSAANGNDIRILGAALVTLSHSDNSSVRTSRQMIYITDATNKDQPRGLYGSGASPQRLPQPLGLPRPPRHHNPESDPHQPPGPVV